MKTSTVVWGLAIACGLTVCGRAQEKPNAPKAQAPLVIVVGCANRASDGTWQLTKATSPTETRQPFASVKELQDATKKPLGGDRYKLIGTADFVTKEELLKTQQRAEFTRPEVANATGMLQDGRKVMVKALLITAPSEKRLNLLSVQKLADTCT